MDLEILKNKLTKLDTRMRSYREYRGFENNTIKTLWERDYQTCEEILHEFNTKNRISKSDMITANTLYGRYNYKRDYEL